VQPGAHLDAERLHRVADRHGAADRSLGPSNIARKPLPSELVAVGAAGLTRQADHPLPAPDHGHKRTPPSTMDEGAPLGGIS